MWMSNKIQRIELNKFYDVDIHCPFCGQKVIDYPDGDLNACKHTLFIAHDMGLEYRSQLFEQNLGISGIENDDIQLPEHGWDGLTDQVSVTDAIKFASYVGAPSGSGTYIGFSPSYE
jgi:hypothetical protein